MRVVLILLLLPLIASAQVPRPFAPIDVFELEWAQDPEISRDGSRLIYTRNFFDKMSDKRRANLWEIDLKTGDQQPLTTGSRNDGAAQFSSDGQRIVYLSDANGSAQLHVRWLKSDRVAQVTRTEGSPSGYRFSPDGRQIAFLLRVPLKTKPLTEAMPSPPKGATWAEPVKIIDQALYRLDGAGYLDPASTQIFVVPADGGSARRVSQVDANFSGLVWSADSKSLFATANLDKDAALKPIESEIYRIDVLTGGLTQLSSRVGPDGDLALSPDGRTLVYTGFDDKRQFYQVRVLYALDLASGKSRAVTASFDRDVQQPVFGADSRSVYFAFDDHGDGKIGRVELATGVVSTVASDLGGTAMGRPYGGGSFSVALNNTIAYTRSSDQRPADVALLRGRDKPRSLTALNEDALNTVAIAPSRRISVKASTDGRAIDAWVVNPPQFDPSKKYPLLLEIHGGPVANYGPRFAPEIQLYAAQGYVVVFANPRGSDSYGAEFGNAIHHDYPNKDFNDLMDVVDAVIGEGAIDERNLFITGGSGGGVLTAWAVAHSDRFRAAVVAKPVINWYSFVLTTDIYPLVADYWFPGPPWEHTTEYMERSPIHHVGKIKTPTMLITGDADLRTPIAQSEELYQALKLRGVDTLMVRIPGASHSINARPSNLIAQVLNTVAWFERYRVQ